MRARTGNLHAFRKTGKRMLVAGKEGVDGLRSQLENSTDGRRPVTTSEMAKDNRSRQRSGEESSDKAIVDVASRICSGPP